jgi:hypothetical protein
MKPSFFVKCFSSSIPARSGDGTIATLPAGVRAVCALTGLVLLGGILSTRGDALDNWNPSQLKKNFDGGTPRWLYGAAYGNGTFVAAGSGDGGDLGVIEASVDGTTWTLGTNKNQGGYIWEIYDVTFANGVFVAVGWDYYTGQNLWHSTDGVRWAPHQTAIANVNRVVYGAGLFVAVGDGLLLNQGNTYTNWNIYTSPDGITWTARRSVLQVADARAIGDVAYGAGRFVAIDSQYYTGQGNYFYTSTTGTSWTRSTNSYGGYHVRFCNGLFFLGTNMVSADGLNWTQLPNPDPADFTRMVYADGCYLGLAGSSVYSSVDGTNWVQHAPSAMSGNTVLGVTYGQNRFLAVGCTGSLYGPSSSALAFLSDPTVSTGINPGFPPQVKVSGLAGHTYRIEQRDSLGGGSWQPANTNSAGVVPFTWTDPQPTNGARFYRAVRMN